jgi:hypothetical protein
MTIISTIFGVNDRSLPPKVERSEDEQKLLEGRLLRSAFAIAALAVVALYAADSFVEPTDPGESDQRVAPAPLM